MLSVLAFMLIGCISTVSAGWFDFMSGEHLDSDVIDVPQDVTNVTYDSNSSNFIQIFAHVTEHRDKVNDIEKQGEYKGYTYTIDGSSADFELQSKQLDLNPDLFLVDGSNDISSFNNTLNKLMYDNSFNPANAYVVFYDEGDNEVLTKNLSNANFSLTKFVPNTRYGDNGGYFVRISFNEKLNDSYEKLYSMNDGKGKVFNGKLCLLLDSDSGKFLLSVPLGWDTNSDLSVDVK